MKKFVLVIVTICVLAILVSLNYLLWDNRNKQQKIQSLSSYKENTNHNLEQLHGEIEQLKSENEDFQDIITSHKIRINSYQTTIDGLEQDVDNEKAKSADKDIIIGFLKKIIDISMFTDIINRWISSINQGEYKKAYEIQRLRDVFGTKEVINFETFKSYFSNIERIDLKTVEINLNDVDRLNNNEVAFTLIVDVTKINSNAQNKNQVTSLMYEGANRAVLVFKYDESNDSWYIYQMTFYRYSMNSSE